MHYLAVKSYLHYCIEKRQSDFYCLNCLNSFRTENKLKSHEKVCKIKISKISYNKIFHGKCISHRNEKKTLVLMNYLELSILDLIKTVTCEFRYDYIKSKYRE